MVGTTNGKKPLIFGGDPVLDTNTGSLIHFPEHCRIGHLLAFFI